ncbi:MAG: NTP transferase domain-containing protein [Thermodesulfobacteriota bacterium]
MGPSVERFFEKNPSVFILPIDVPCAKKEVFEKLIRGLNPSVEVVIPRYQSRGGHPVLLSAAFLYRLDRVPLDSPEARLDFQIQALSPRQRALVAVEDEQVGLNINTMAEFYDYIR